MLTDRDINGFPEHNDRAQLIQKQQFIDSLADDDIYEGSGGSDSGMDLEEDLEEEIEIEISSGSESSEDEEEDLSMSQPVKRRSHSRVTKSIKSRSCGSSKSRRMKREPNMEDAQAYDPSTCRKWPIRNSGFT